MRWKNIEKTDSTAEEIFKALRKTDSSWKCEKDREVERITDRLKKRRAGAKREKHLLQRGAYCSNRMLRRSALLIRTIQSFSWNRASRSAFPPLSSLLTNKPSVLEQSQYILLTFGTTTALFPDQLHRTLLSNTHTQLQPAAYTPSFNLMTQCNLKRRDILRNRRPL